MELASTAPISQGVADTLPGSGRIMPRWSVGGALVQAIASMAALPVPGNRVFVRPPLSPSAPSFGSPTAPGQLESVLGQRRLPLPSIIVPLQLPLLLLATMLFVTVNGPELLELDRLPPKLLSVLPAIVLLLTLTPPPLMRIALPL